MIIEQVSWISRTTGIVGCGLPEMPNFLARLKANLCTVAERSADEHLRKRDRRGMGARRSEVLGLVDFRNWMEEMLGKARYSIGNMGGVRDTFEFHCRISQSSVITSMDCGEITLSLTLVG